MVLSMRTAVRLLMCMAISSSLALAAMPAQAAAPQVKKGCCAAKKIDPQVNDCDQHAPKSNEDKQCCSMCAFCIAVLAMKTSFVYPPTGQESFAILSISERIRSDQPPVPPPRA